MNTTSESTKKFRADIQILRGFAVLLVVAYHADIPLVPAGYLGVDVFFVISGFLITRLIKDKIHADDFSISQFYFRRAKRLLPAAYVTFTAVTVLSPFFLASSEINDFRAQAAGAVSFTANFVLWRQSGYFGGEAELKPFLHIWSLAIEEQYYFILPALMLIIPHRLWKPSAVILLGASLALCLYMVSKNPSATFYLLPTRAWELAAGSVGALIAMKWQSGKLVKQLFWPSLVALITLPMVSIANFHPGPDAILICIATLIVILRNHESLPENYVTHAMSRVGDISYSLYLVHWPVFSFLNNSWVGDAPPPFTLRLGCIALSVVLAFMLNHYIEEPMRRTSIRSPIRLVTGAAFASVALVLTVFLIAGSVQSERDYAEARRANYGMNAACEFKGDFSPLPECRNSDNPTLLVWGDSFAMHLVPGLLANTSKIPSIIQATRSACGPLIGTALIYNGQSALAEDCAEFNDSVLRYLKETSSITTVVLASPFSYYVDTASQFKLLDRDKVSGEYLTIDQSVKTTVERLRSTVDAVRALGKKVVVVAPPPSGGFNSARCLERLDNDLPSLGETVGCRISQLTYMRDSRLVLQLLRKLPDEADVGVVSFDGYLCSAGFCETRINGKIVYRDAGHLSYEGSTLLATETKLLERISTLAR